jgi:hypothetical protein
LIAAKSQTQELVKIHQGALLIRVKLVLLLLSATSLSTLLAPPWILLMVLALPYIFFLKVFINHLVSTVLLSWVILAQTTMHASYLMLLAMAKDSPIIPPMYE